MNNILIISLTAFISWMILLVVIPFAKCYLLDQPNQRSSHKIPIPLGGSISFIIIAFLGSYVTKNYIPLIFVPLAIVGFMDDIKSLTVSIRLFFQTLSCVLCMYFYAKESLIFSNQLYQNLPLLTLLILLIGVSLINFCNFMDGMDGLLGGSMIILFLVSGILINPIYFYFVGALIGYLFLNWSPAKIFMGDAGSYFLGGILFCAILESQKIEYSLAILLIGSPLFIDASTTVIRRYAASKPLFKAHNKFLFHRLRNAGWEQSSVSLLYLIATSILAISYFIGGIKLLFIFSLFKLIYGIWLDKNVAVKFDLKSNKKILKGQIKL